MSALVPIALGAFVIAVLAHPPGATAASGPALRSSGIPFAPRLLGARWPVTGPDRQVPRVLASGMILDNDRTGFSADRYFLAHREGARLHAGVDLRAPVGSRILSMAPGRVVAFPTGYNGLDAIAIDHGPVTLIYAEIHRALALKIGDTVGKGVTIGTGAASAEGAQLHLETWTPKSAPSSFQALGEKGFLPGLLDPTALLLAAR